MNFEQAIRAELITLANLNNKVFPMSAPEGTATPFVTYQKTNADFIKTMDGTSLTRIGRFEIDILSNTYTQLTDLLTAVKNKLVSFEKTTIGTNGVYVQSVVIDNIIEMYEELPKFYRANIEIRFYYVGE